MNSVKHTWILQKFVMILLSYFKIGVKNAWHRDTCVLFWFLMTTNKSIKILVRQICIWSVTFRYICLCMYGENPFALPTYNTFFFLPLFLSKRIKGKLMCLDDRYFFPCIRLTCLFEGGVLLWREHQVYFWKCYSLTRTPHNHLKLF